MVKKSCSILLVDRDHASAALLAKALKAQSHTVFSARDLAHAVSILEFRAFEVLIVDVNPSDPRELDVINWTASLTPRPRIIVTGGAVPAEGEQALFDRGTDLYLLKPVDVSTLVDFIARTRSRSSFSGMVRGVDIIEYVQFVMLGGRKTVLEVTSSLGTRGRLFLADGNIVHADCGLLLGEPALYRCLCFKEGSFAHEPWEDPDSVTINKPGEFLLMEAIRKRDEAWAGRPD